MWFQTCRIFIVEQKSTRCYFHTWGWGLSGFNSDDKKSLDESYLNVNKWKIAFRVIFSNTVKNQKLRKLKSLRKPASGDFWVFSTFSCINWKQQVEKPQKSPEADWLKLLRFLNFWFFFYSEITFQILDFSKHKAMFALDFAHLDWTHWVCTL